MYTDSVTPSEMERAIQRLNDDLSIVMKQRVIERMEEILKPELDKILDETAEEMMKSFKARITSGYDMMTMGYVFKLIINKEEKVI